MTDAEPRVNPDSLQEEGCFSEVEERFDRGRRTVGLFLGPLASLLIFLWPMPSLSAKAHLLAAVMGWVVAWWVTEAVPIPVTALLAPVMCILLGIADPKSALAPFADPVIFLFLGSFVLAQAMSIHGLDRRFAFFILSLRWVGGRSGRVLFAYGAIAVLLSMWISNTGTTAMLMPIGVGIVGAVSKMGAEQRGQPAAPKGGRFATGLMLMAAYGASLGGIGTPVGTPPNLIGIAMIEKYVGKKIPFFQWMTFTVPMMLFMFGVLFLLLYWLHRPEFPVLPGGSEYARRELKALGKWTVGQRNAMMAFLFTVTLWLLPGFLAVIVGMESPVYRTYSRLVPESLAALAGILLLFVLPVDWRKRKFTITWKQASAIDWGTLLLFGGGISLGNLMFSTGLAEKIGRGLLRLTAAESTWGITAAAIAIAIIVSETTSNTASANMVVPVMIALAGAAGVDPLAPALGATLGASWGFMLPISTPPNAIVYGTGMVPITRMIRAGFLFDVLGWGLIWLGLRLLLPLVGLLK